MDLSSIFGGDDDDEINSKADLAAEQAGLLPAPPVSVNPNLTPSQNASLMDADYDVQRAKYREQYKKYLEDEKDGSTLSSNFASALFAVLPAVAGYAIDGKRGAGTALTVAGQQTIPDIYKTAKKEREAEKAKEKALLDFDRDQLKDQGKLVQNLAVEGSKSVQRGIEREAGVQDRKEVARFTEGLRRGRPGKGGKVDVEDPDIAEMVSNLERRANGENVRRTAAELRGMIKVPNATNINYATGLNTRQADPKLEQQLRDSFDAVSTIDSLLTLVDNPNSSTAGPVAALKSYIPSTDAYKYSAELQPLQQAIASARQAGVLTDQDRDIYAPVVSGDMVLESERDQIARLEKLKARTKKGIRRVIESRQGNTNLDSIFKAYPELLSPDPSDKESKKQQLLAERQQLLGGK